MVTERREATNVDIDATIITGATVERITTMATIVDAVDAGMKDTATSDDIETSDIETNDDIETDDIETNDDIETDDIETNDDIEMNDIEANTDTASASRRTRTSPSTTANLPPPPTPPVTPSRRLLRANLTPRSAKMKSSPNSNASSTGERSTDEFVASTRGDRRFADGLEEAPPFSSAI